MDKKELLRRWVLGYVEPSLFYLPQKDEDEYYTVTIIPQIDYFDTYDEKVITDVTFGDVYTKGYINANNQRFGGLAYSDMIRESNFYVAYDTQGNVADCSLWRDFMSMAVCRYSDDKGSYILEYYHAPSFLSDSNQEIRVIKNVPNTDYAKQIFDDGWRTYYNNYGNSVLFIFESGEIYVWKLVDSTTNPWTYEMSRVGYYDYKTDKYSFDDNDFYFTYMILGSYWNTPNNQPMLFSASGQVLMDNGHAILRLKKGVYTIEQGVSSIGCEMMPAQTITVNGNMTLYYKTILNGIVIRSELQDCADPYHLLYDNSNNGWKEKWFIESGSYGSLECVNSTYRLSDYSLQVKQQLITWCGDGSNIPSKDGTRLNYYTGKHIRFFTTNDGTEDGEIIATMYDNILSKRSLSAEECSELGLNGYIAIGTQITPTSVYYYGKPYVQFWVREVSKTPHGYPLDFNIYDYYPTIIEIEGAINKKKLTDWVRLSRNPEYIGEIIKEDEYMRYYIQAYSNIRIINTYQYTSNYRNQVIFSDVVYANENSTVNMVKNFQKADSADIDEYIKYTNMSQRYDYVQVYNEDGSILGSQAEYKNYVTCVSPEYKISDKWTDEEYTKLQVQMKEKLYEEQLK